MSDRQVRDEAMTLFLAGHETTANLLTWTLYLLSQHPEDEERVVSELAAGAETTQADRVLSEALRLYPPAWVIGRRALADVDLGRIVILAGMLAVVSPWVTHRDPRWYPEPERFDPGRWEESERDARPQYAFFRSAPGRECASAKASRWPKHVPSCGCSCLVGPSASTLRSESTCCRASRCDRATGCG